MAGWMQVRDDGRSPFFDLYVGKTAEGGPRLAPEWFAEHHRAMLSDRGNLRRLLTCASPFGSGDKFGQEWERVWLNTRDG